MIYVQISQNNEILVREPTIADSVKFETVKFHFPKSWETLTKTAVFTYSDEQPINVILNSGLDSSLEKDECYIPFEVLKTPSFKISVFGTKGDTKATATETEITVLKSGYALGEDAANPTPSAYEQLVDIATEAKTIANSVKTAADSGAFKGDKGEQGPKGDTGPQGEKGEKGDNGGIVDQTFNPESENAQSGKAISPILNTYATKKDLDSKQSLLISGENIKTINGKSILDEGDIALTEKNRILKYLEYDIFNGEVTIISCNTYITGKHIIPDVIEGYPVTTIGDNAFKNCFMLESITIPNGVSEIGKSAFKGCEMLSSIVLPKKLNTLNNAVFSGCVCLANVSIPKTVNTIGVSAFSGCAITSINIPKSVILIDYGAFENCAFLSNVYYDSSQEDWYEISIDELNDKLGLATIHYNQESATKDFVESQINSSIGNISSALDELHNYAQYLIDGGAPQ